MSLDLKKNIKKTEIIVLMSGCVFNTNHNKSAVSHRSFSSLDYGCVIVYQWQGESVNMQTVLCVET